MILPSDDDQADGFARESPIEVIEIERPYGCVGPYAVVTLERLVAPVFVDVRCFPKFRLQDRNPVP